MLGGINMYVKQFWQCFEETGDVSTYLCLKEYEKLYHEHTDSSNVGNEGNIEIKDVDGMK